jgi:hypothetical protein
MFKVLPVDDVELRYAVAAMVVGQGVVWPCMQAPSGARTVTVKLRVPTFPAASVPVQVTVVTPIGNKKLLGDEQVSCMNAPVRGLFQRLALPPF